MKTNTTTIAALAVLAALAVGYAGYRWGLAQGHGAAGAPGATAAPGGAAAGSGPTMARGSAGEAAGPAAATATPGAAPQAASGTSAGAGSGAPQKAGDVDPATGRRVLYWHDPMVPGKRFDRPGKSPFMDMQLVPVYADADADSGTVGISPRVQQNLGVRTAQAVLGTLDRSLEVPGAIAWNERDVAVVTARTGGFVERLHVRAPLEPVTRGQPLVEIYAPDWVAAQEEFLAVRRMQATGTGALVDAARQRMLLAGMTDEQVRAVEAAGSVQPRFTLRAPIAGVIGELAVREGMTLMPGAMLFRINGLASVWVNAEVPEARAALLRVGAPVQARTPSLPERVFKGRVAAVLPDVNPVTRTIRARVEIANPGGALAPGMFASVDLMPPGVAKRLLVPSEAVIPTGERKLVILALDGGRFKPVPVQTGEEAGGMTEIRAGLSEGQKVVVSGQFLLDSEASLRASAERMGDAPAPGGAAGAGASAPTGHEGHGASPAPGAAAAAAPAAAGKTAAAPATPVHRAEGVVVDIDAQSALIKHGAITTAGMGAMTMEFGAPSAGMPKNVKKGDPVAFAFTITTRGEFRLQSIEVRK